jgi:hypothetical protein
MLKCITVAEYKALNLYLRFYSARVGVLESVLDTVLDDFTGLLDQVQLHDKAGQIYALRSILDLPIEQPVEVIFHYPEEEPLSEVVEKPLSKKENVVNLFNKTKEN